MPETGTFQRPTRFPEIDLLRSVAILLMIVYHLAFDLAIFHAVAIDPFSGGWLILERVTANLFLLLVGVSFAVSSERMERKGVPFVQRLRKYVRRGILILLCGILVSLATYFFDPSTYVRFGVLHLIGVSILLLPFLMPLREWNALLAIPMFFAGKFLAALTVTTSLLLPFGLHPTTFQTVDYFPLFPWLSAILVGAAIGNFIYNRIFLHPQARRPAAYVDGNKFVKILTIPGRYSLIIYLLHQPILLGILWIVFR